MNAFFGVYILSQKFSLCKKKIHLASLGTDNCVASCIWDIKQLHSLASNNIQRNEALQPCRADP